MASSREFVDYIMGQIAKAGSVTCKKMFGEYGVYIDNKIVALVCDNNLYVKPTDGGRSFIGDVREAAPYPGAKPYYLIDDRIEDHEWISELIRITARELPEQKKRKSGRGKQ